ncbi:MAG: hypothetical protein HOV79_15440 [Hamadaea sp.]|nr:hypothetical protein [Hamadaea sp.]
MSLLVGLVGGARSQTVARGETASANRLVPSGTPVFMLGARAGEGKRFAQERDLIRSDGAARVLVGGEGEVRARVHLQPAARSLVTAGIRR